MRILLYGINFAPELTGIGKYTGEMAAWLAARGHQVRVVTAPPYYPAWKVAGGFKNRWHTEAMQSRVAGARRHDDTGSLVVFRCPLWVPPQPGGAKRLVHLASFALTSLPVLLRQMLWRPDVVWVVEPALFCAPAAWAVARLSGARAWLHVQDFEVDAAFDLGLLRGKLLRGAVTGAERWLMRRFDVVSTISQRMHQRLLDKGVAPARAVMAVNWVDMAAFALPTVDGVAAYRQELGVPDGAVVALYSGNMGAKQGLELLAEVARLCQVGIRGEGAAPTGAGFIRGGGAAPTGAGFIRGEGAAPTGAGFIRGEGAAPTGAGFIRGEGAAPTEAGFIRGGGAAPTEAGFIRGGGAAPTGGGFIRGGGAAPAGAGFIRGGGAAPTGAAAPVFLAGAGGFVGAAPSPRMPPELVFVFCGNGAGRADLVARCQGLKNVRFLDLQPLARLPDLLAFAHIHLLPQRADAADLVMPSKLTGMLASARPVVATAKPGTELAHVVQGCGLVVPPEDPAAFADALMVLATDPVMCERLGAAGYLYAQTNLDKEAVLGKFEADLLALVLVGERDRIK